MNPCDIDEIISGKTYLLKDINGNIVELVRLSTYTFEFGEFKLQSELYPAFGKKLHNYFKINSSIIQTDDRDYDRPKIKLLAENGFEVYYSKIIYTKDLDEHEFLFEDNFEYRSLKETGIEEFLQTYKLVLSEDPEGNVDPKTDFNDLVEYAGAGFDPGKWLLVMLNGKAIGVIMPQKYESKESIGGDMHIGIIPEERNMGYGKILFSKSLQLLKDDGIKKYIGSTNVNNIPMRKVFEFSGCKEWFKRFFYRAKT